MWAFHASIIDGIMLSKASFTRFRHNDYSHLRVLLEKHAPAHKNILVIVESVYSMDGDRADIEELLLLKREFPNVTLYVDEAHAFGVLGPYGLGLVADSSAPWEVDVTIGTFGNNIHYRLAIYHIRILLFRSSTILYISCSSTSPKTYRSIIRSC